MSGQVSSMGDKSEMVMNSSHYLDNLIMGVYCKCIMVMGERIHSIETGSENNTHIILEVA